jgi:hypothetical protein
MSIKKDAFETIYTISIDEAVHRTGLYQEQGHKVKALSVSFNDLVGLVNLYNAMNEGQTMPESMYSAVRIYMGINDDGTECAVLVPVIGYAGKDAPGTDVLGIPLAGGPEESFCYDFSHPCPSTCDVNSRLYHTKTQQQQSIGNY